MLLSSGGWVAECGLTSMQHSDGLWPVQSAVRAGVSLGLVFYIGWVIFACTYLALRAPREDETLRNRFGKEWEEYRTRVRWRFIPCVA